MDTDDVARPDRMEKQLAAIENGLDMVGSDVIEFVTSPDNPVAITNLPKGIDAIRSYSRRRNPFRHPPMTFRKSKVVELEIIVQNFFTLRTGIYLTGCLPVVAKPIT